MSKVSATALAKQLDVQSKVLFSLFLEQGYLEEVDPESNGGCKWLLTDKGKIVGGDYKESSKHGKYIVWPHDLSLNSLNDKVKKYHDSITSTEIGKSLGISPRKVNLILSELGFVSKSIKGWKLTDHGINNGGIQDENSKTGVPFVRWSESILKHPILRDAVNNIEEVSIEQPKIDSSDFRKKFKAEIRTSDGHYVRSKAEFIIDNQLYLFGVVHAYEKRLPIEEECYCDFYIPAQKLYIEYWGLENDPKYQARKKEKIAIYEKYGFNLIQLEDGDIQNIEDVLARYLLKFNIEVN